MDNEKNKNEEREQKMQKAAEKIIAFAKEIVSDEGNHKMVMVKYLLLQMEISAIM